MSIESTDRGMSRGAKLCIGLIVLGGVFVGGLIALKPSAPPRVPMGTVVGVPRTPMRVMSMNVENRSVDDVLAALKPLSPDIVLLQHVDAANVLAIVGAMDMAAAHHPANYQPTQNVDGKTSEYGTLILSQYKVCEATALRNDGVGFGVRAICVVEDRGFVVASVDWSREAGVREKEEGAMKTALKGPSIVGSDDTIELSDDWQIRERRKVGAMLVVARGK